MEGLSKQAPVTEEQQQSPLAAIEEVLVYYIKNKFEQQKAMEQSLTLTCPSPMSCSHHKEEMVELVKKRIIVKRTIPILANFMLRKFCLL